MISYVFFGTPQFAVCVLDELKHSGYLPRAVVCGRDRPKGRGRKLASPPVKLWTKKYFIEVLQPHKQKEPSFIERLHELNPDVCVVAGFGQFLPKVLLQIPRMGFVNVHPSLLPKYRGSAPIQWALINGEKYTGVSIVKVTPRLDAGDVILQKPVAIEPYHTCSDLQHILANQGGKLLVQALERYEQGIFDATPQDEKKAVWARSLTKQDGEINWSKTAPIIHNFIRGVDPWPGAFTFLNNKILKIHSASLVNIHGIQDNEPGKIIRAQGNELVVKTGGGLLKLAEVQLEGKKRLPVKEFLLGQRLKRGDFLG